MQPAPTCLEVSIVNAVLHAPASHWLVQGEVLHHSWQHGALLSRRTAISPASEAPASYWQNNNGHPLKFELPDSVLLEGSLRLSVQRVAGPAPEAAALIVDTELFGQVEVDLGALRAGEFSAAAQTLALPLWSTRAVPSNLAPVQEEEDAGSDSSSGAGAGNPGTRVGTLLAEFVVQPAARLGQFWPSQAVSELLLTKQNIAPEALPPLQAGAVEAQLARPWLVKQDRHAAAVTSVGAVMLSRRSHTDPSMVKAAGCKVGQAIGAVLHMGHSSVALLPDTAGRVRAMHCVAWLSPEGITPARATTLASQYLDQLWLPPNAALNSEPGIIDPHFAVAAQLQPTPLGSQGTSWAAQHAALLGLPNDALDNVGARVYCVLVARLDSGDIEQLAFTTLAIADIMQRCRDTPMVSLSCELASAHLQPGAALQAWLHVLDGPASHTLQAVCLSLPSAPSLQGPLEIAFWASSADLPAPSTPAVPAWPSLAVRHPQELVGPAEPPACAAGDMVLLSKTTVPPSDNDTVHLLVYLPLPDDSVRAGDTWSLLVRSGGAAAWSPIGAVLALPGVQDDGSWRLAWALHQTSKDRKLKLLHLQHGTSAGSAVHLAVGPARHVLATLSAVAHWCATVTTGWFHDKQAVLAVAAGSGVPQRRAVHGLLAFADEPLTPETMFWAVEAQLGSSTDAGSSTGDAQATARSTIAGGSPPSPSDVREAGPRHALAQSSPAGAVSTVADVAQPAAAAAGQRSAKQIARLERTLQQSIQDLQQLRRENAMLQRQLSAREQVNGGSALAPWPLLDQLPIELAEEVGSKPPTQATQEAVVTRAVAKYVRAQRKQHPSRMQQPTSELTDTVRALTRALARARLEYAAAASHSGQVPATLIHSARGSYLRGVGLTTDVGKLQHEVLELRGAAGAQATQLRKVEVCVGIRRTLRDWHALWRRTATHGCA